MAEGPVAVPQTMHAAVAAAALAQGRRLDVWSLALTLLAFAALLWRQLSGPVAAALLVCVALGLAQRALAARVAFDAALFRRLAHSANSAAPADVTPALAALDSALDAAGLRAAPAGAPRLLRDRIRGAMRLLRLQAACLVGQCLALLAATAG